MVKFLILLILTITIKHVESHFLITRYLISNPTEAALKFSKIMLQLFLRYLYINITQSKMIYLIDNSLNIFNYIDIQDGLVKMYVYAIQTCGDAQLTCYKLWKWTTLIQVMVKRPIFQLSYWFYKIKVIADEIYIIL